MGRREAELRRWGWLALPVLALLAGAAWLWGGGLGPQPQPDRAALYRELGDWLQAQPLPEERVAFSLPAFAGYLGGRPGVALPADGSAAVLKALQQERPEYCLAFNSVIWQGIEDAPWFQEHYRAVYRAVSPYDSAAPLVLFRYTPSPFDAGERISRTVRLVPGPGEALTLEGYRLDSFRLIPAEPLHLTLFWRAERSLHTPLRLTLRLIETATGRVRLHAERAAAEGMAPEAWPVGATLEDRYRLEMPAELPAGDYRLELTLSRPNGSPVGADGESVLIAPALVQPPSVSRTPPHPDFPLDVTLDDGVGLAGYDAPLRATPGMTVRVALYWQAGAPIAGDYKVFVHLLGGDGTVVAQDDSAPVAWTYPTTRWQAGETVRDEHLLGLPTDLPRGDYRLRVGIYDPQTGRRLAARDGAGTALPDGVITLETIEVR